MADTASSVSKGCFAYLGKVKRANAEEYLQTSSDRFIKGRFKLYNQLRNDLHTKINVLRSDLNSKIFDNLISFAASCNRHMSESSSRSLGEILTAVLITGVNTPDHDVMFTSLGRTLKTKVSPLVAHVRSQDCSRVSVLVANVVQQITNISAPADDDDEEADVYKEIGHKQDFECGPIKLNASIKNKRAVTLTTLATWYNKNYAFKTESYPSPNKKIKLSNSPKKKTQHVKTEAETKKDKMKNHQPVVVMLEDAENTDPGVLQDFISLCSSNLASVPIVLVLGIATSVTVIHQLLPPSVSSLLCIEKFQAPTASSYLTHLMDQIIMTPDVPFKLGPKVFHFLLDVFLYHDFSIMNFIMGFEYSMAEHYLSNPLSLLCCSQSEVNHITSHLTHEQLEDIRRQHTFMRYVESKPGQEQAKFLMDDSATRKYLCEELTDLHTFHAKMFMALRFLHCLCSGLPKHPLGKQFRELYSTCLAQEICQSEGYEQAFSLLRMMSCDDLCELLSQSLKVLSKSKDDITDIGNLCKDVESFIYRLHHIDEEQESNDGIDDASGTSRILPQRAKLHELKKKLQSMTATRKKSPYEQLRDKIFDTLDGHFQVLLACPMSRPLHDILYFNNLSAVKDHIKASPRCSIQRALTQPGQHLNCVCCQCDTDSILPSMPDICIVYKLHLECGTLINLYDWLQAFVTIVTSSETSGQNGRKRKKTPETNLRARFIRAVSELQFLGFIKGTQRKTDHVTRLTW